MKHITPWSLLVVFAGLPILLIAINKATPQSPTADATELATDVLGITGDLIPALLLLVVVAILVGWSYDSGGGGF